MKRLLFLLIFCTLMCNCSSNEEQLLEEMSIDNTKSNNSSNGIKQYTVNYNSKTFKCGILWEINNGSQYASTGTAGDRIIENNSFSSTSHQLISTYDRCEFVSNNEINIFIKANYIIEHYHSASEIGHTSPYSTTFEKVTITGKYNTTDNSFSGSTSYQGPGQWLPED